MRISRNYWKYWNYIVTYVVRSLVLRSFVCSIVRTLFVRSLVLTNTIARAYDRSCLRSLVFTIARAYDRSCLRSLVLTIARAYDHSCLRSLVLTIARAYDRSCLRSLVLTIARAYDRSCLRSLVLTIARVYGRSCLRSLVLTVDRSCVRSFIRSMIARLFFRYHCSIPRCMVFVNTFNDVYSVVVLTVCTMKCILSLNTPHLALKTRPKPALSWAHAPYMVKYDVTLSNCHDSSHEKWNRR